MLSRINRFLLCLHGTRFVPLGQLLSHIAAQESAQPVRTWRSGTVLPILYSQCLLAHPTYVTCSVVGLWNEPIDKVTLSVGCSCDSCPRTVHNIKLEIVCYLFLPRDINARRKTMCSGRLFWLTLEFSLERGRFVHRLGTWILQSYLGSLSSAWLLASDLTFWACLLILKMSILL